MAIYFLCDSFCFHLFKKKSNTDWEQEKERFHLPVHSQMPTTSMAGPGIPASHVGSTYPNTWAMTCCRSGYTPAGSWIRAEQLGLELTSNVRWRHPRHEANLYTTIPIPKLPSSYDLIWGKGWMAEGVRKRKSEGRRERESKYTYWCLSLFDNIIRVPSLVLIPNYLPKTSFLISLH